MLISKHMNELKQIPISIFVGVAVDQYNIYYCVNNEKSLIDLKVEINNNESLDNQVYEWLKKYANKKNVKIIAIGISECKKPEDLGEKLWLELDIVPFLKIGNGETPQERAHNLSQEIHDKYKKEQNLDVIKIGYNEHDEVIPSFLTTLNAYKTTSDQNNFSRLLAEAKRFKGLEGKMMFISATPQGGGVALMRHALIRLFNQMNLDVSWFVLKADYQAFDITKRKFHNTLQGVSKQKDPLDEKDKKIYNDWIKQNAEILKESIKDSKVIVIDDWQPSGLIKYIKEYNPKAKIIFRSHIHIDTSLFTDEECPQKITWNFLWRENRIEEAELFIAHPIEDFVPDDVPKSKRLFMPATTDKLDGLNKPLTHDQIEYYINILNHILINDGQTSLDISRPYITQIARFDPSKGIPDVLESYLLLRRKIEESDNKIPIPQLVIAGHGSIDDPDGIPILENTKMTLTLERYKDIANDVKIARLSHNDQILNAIISASNVVMQLSHKEGFEIKISEAINKNKPVIIYRAGGMPLQVSDKQDGFIIEVGNTMQVADKLFDLFNYQDLYKQISDKKESLNKSQFFTLSNGTNWLFLANELMQKTEVKGNGRDVKDML